LKIDSLFLKKAEQWATQFEVFAILNSNHFNEDKYAKYNSIIACNSVCSFESNRGLDELNHWINAQNDWIFGHLNYDVKNEIEHLFSKENSFSTFPNIHFFVPETLILEDTLGNITIQSKRNVSSVFAEINAQKITKPNRAQPCVFDKTLSKEDYFHSVVELKKHIVEGNIYEINFCNNVSAKKIAIQNVLATYSNLKSKTEAPFSVLYHLRSNYLMCASPERFMKREHRTLISQPIKGTIQRGKNALEDDNFKEKLALDEKERAENVMIVDLVRNDLSKIAETGSVKVSELFGVYTFKTVHQMISTIEATMLPNIDFVDIIKALFPMGSMTGAPKVKAMQIIDEYEPVCRGIFSGTFGYIDSDKNFDFNVVIRSIIYQAAMEKVQIFAGSAITHYASPENEYKECLLKLNAMLNSLNGSIEK